MGQADRTGTPAVAGRRREQQHPVGRLGAIAAVAVLVAGLAACGDDGEGGSDEEPAEEERSEEAEEALAEAREEATPEEELREDGLTGDDAVLADYAASADAVVVAHDPPDPEHPDLLTYFDGEALERFQVRLENYRVDGLSVVAVSSERDPEVTHRSSTVATIEDCLVEDLEFRDIETGEARDTRHDEGHLVVQLERSEHEIWQVVSIEFGEETC